MTLTPTKMNDSAKQLQLWEQRVMTSVRLGACVATTYEQTFNDNFTYYHRDVVQQFQMKILEFFQRWGVDYSDAEAVIAMDDPYTYVDFVVAHMEEALANRVRDVEHIEEGSETAVGMLWLLLRNALKETRDTFQLTSKQQELKDEFLSWELEKVQLAMAAGTAGIPSVSHTFDNYQDIHKALDGEIEAIARQYELSESGTTLYEYFRNGTTAQRRAIVLMVQAAQYVEQGVVIPKKLQQKLKYARQQVKDDGWLLKTTLLR